MIAFALLCSSLAALTGIIAIGSGVHWQFSVADYFRGKRNAILYLWVISSTVFSITHSAVIMDYGLKRSWTLTDPANWRWFAIHATVSVLLVLAHLYVRSTLAKEIGPVDKYLWGSRHVQ